MKIEKEKTADTDTRTRIIQSAADLFGQKGFDGTTTREIAKLAGVNIASLNYYFRSKQNLMGEVSAYAFEEFKQKLLTLVSLELKNTTEFVLRLYDSLHEDGSKYLNHFKLFLDAKDSPCSIGEHPIGFEQLSLYLQKDLHPSVPLSERLWMNNVIFSYLFHTAIMTMTTVGKQHVEKFFPDKENSTKLYIRQLVETLIRDLNSRYS